MSYLDSVFIVISPTMSGGDVLEKVFATLEDAEEYVEDENNHLLSGTYIEEMHIECDYDIIIND